MAPGPSQNDIESRLAARFDSEVSAVEERLTNVLTTSFASLAENQRAQNTQIAQLTTGLIEEKTQVRDLMRMEAQARIDDGQRFERLIQQRNFYSTRGGKVKFCDGMRAASGGKSWATPEEQAVQHGRRALSILHLDDEDGARNSSGSNSCCRAGDPLGHHTGEDEAVHPREAREAPIATRWLEVAAWQEGLRETP